MKLLMLNGWRYRAFLARVTGSRSLLRAAGAPQ
jgi:hypothetical protein